MAHHVADEDPYTGIREFYNFEKVAAHAHRGLVKVVETCRALFLGSMMWEARIAVRQHGLLKFPRHFQILFKGLILFAQFSCERGEFFFGSLLLSNVARETKSADDVSAGISQRQL